MLETAVRIPLLRGGFALVDYVDAPLVSSYSWCEKKSPQRLTTYAYATVGRARVAMHRLILDAPKGVLVDHKDHNGLNNTRDNIRLCTYQQNQMNVISRTGTSRFKGVSWHPAASKWQAAIRVNRCNQYLGVFALEEDAARAYDLKARELFGEFAFLNFPAEAQS